jgi:hypothetical protein
MSDPTLVVAHAPDQITVAGTASAELIESCLEISATLVQQHLFAADKGCDLAAEFVKIPFTACFADKTRHAIHRFGIANLAPHFNGRIGNLRLPFLQRLFCLAQPRDLLGIIADGVFQSCNIFKCLLATCGLWRKEIFLTRQQVSAHTGFHIDSRPTDSRRLPQNPIGVIDLFVVVDDRHRRGYADSPQDQQYRQRRTYSD